MLNEWHNNCIYKKKIMITEKQLIEKIKETDGVKIVVAKKKKNGTYTIYPQVTEVVHTNVQLIGECYAIVYED